MLRNIFVSVNGLLIEAPKICRKASGLGWNFREDLWQVHSPY